MTVTLKDVAKRAGVSIPTVSLIINGRNLPFKESTRQAVLDAVEALNYRPDSMARRNANKSNRRDAVALLLRSESKSRVANSPAYEFICGVNDVLMEQNQFLVMMKLHQLELLDQSGIPPRVIAERFIDGLIVETGLPDQLATAVERYRIPTIWLNTNHHLPHDCIYPDEVHAGRLVTNKLIALGHKRIVFCGPLSTNLPIAAFSIEDRQAGYEQALNEHGLPIQVVREERVPDPATDAAAGTVGTLSADLATAMNAILQSRKTDSPITAIVTYDLVQAVRIRELLQAAQISCPRDISIAAAEDLRFVRRMWPEISGITLDRYQMGGHAAEMMLAKISANGEPQASFVYRGKWIEGTSTARPGEPIKEAKTLRNTLPNTLRKAPSAPGEIKPKLARKPVIK